MAVLKAFPGGYAGRSGVPQCNEANRRYVEESNRMTNGHDDDPSYCDECDKACTSGSGRHDQYFFCCLCSGFDKADLCEHCAKVGEAA